jgi:hypothetical protein
MAGVRGPFRSAPDNYLCLPQIKPEHIGDAVLSLSETQSD